MTDEISEIIRVHWPADELRPEHPFDRYVRDNGYPEGQIPQAFADWLAGKAGHRVVGISTEGTVEGHPR